MEECQEKGRKKTTENEGNSSKAGGKRRKWRNDRKKVGKNEGKSLKPGGKWRKMEECQEKGRKKTTENEGTSSKAGGETEENGGTPKLNGVPRSLGFGTREFARGCEVILRKDCSCRWFGEGRV